MFWIYRAIRKFFTCGVCRDEYRFEDTYLIFRKECKCSSTYHYDEIKYIIYTVLGNDCYIDVLKKNLNDCDIYRGLPKKGLRFSKNGQEIRKFIYECNIRGISIVPTIKVCSLPSIDRMDYALSTLTFLKKRGMVHILDATNNMIVIGVGLFVWEKLRTNKDGLFEILNSYKEIYNGGSDFNYPKKDFWVEIIDASYTLGRGFGLYPMLNGEIILAEIYYSFDKNKIETKLIELFEKYGRKRIP